MINEEKADLNGIMDHQLEEHSGNEENQITGKMKTVSILVSLMTKNGMT